MVSGSPPVPGHSPERRPRLGGIPAPRCRAADRAAAVPGRAPPFLRLRCDRASHRRSGVRVPQLHGGMTSLSPMIGRAVDPLPVYACLKTHEKAAELFGGWPREGRVLELAAGSGAFAMRL